MILPSWEEVSAAIEKADSEHCAALEKDVAVKEENKCVSIKI